MSRPLRIQYANALYHITVRGNNRQPIFLIQDDRLHFLRILAQAVERFQLQCFAYCLMTNHFHLVIRTQTPNLSQAMRHINGVYTIDYNRTHKRVGHVFQGRFNAKVVEDGQYLLELCRYVILNPVRASICVKPEDYLWSSYRATIGMIARPAFLSSYPILQAFHEDRSKAIRLYKQFVEEGHNHAPWKSNAHKNKLFYGSDAFVENAKRLITDDNEISPRQHQILRPTLRNLLSLPEGVLKAYQNGYTQRQIAEAIHCHYRTVSRRIKELENGRGQV